MRMQLNPILSAACLSVLPCLVQAQSSGHYPLGAEGIKGPSLPPPGWYARDYNIGYYATSLKPNTPPGFEVAAYVNAPRVICMTEYKILGANYGWDVIVPFGNQDVSAGGFHSSSFGLGDIQAEPLLLSWHLDKFDIAAGYAIWAPSGHFTPNDPAKLGKGFWGHMLTAGATFYFDKEKTWALSALNRYEFNMEQDDTGITPGQDYSLEWGLSKSINSEKTIDVGVIGYFMQQTTTDSGPNTTSAKTSVVGLGPEVSAFFPKITLGVSLRYVYELAADNRPQGNTFSLTVTKRF